MTTFNISTRGQGLYEFTRDVQAWLADQPRTDGLLTLFVRHTCLLYTSPSPRDRG